MLNAYMEQDQQSIFKKLKIKSIKSLGKREVFDIEVPKTHNFILDNGVVAHNCKAHATNYAILGYACAFLKQNFPLEWWTAVLSNATREDVEKDFWPVCGHLIDLPDIRNSGANFQIKGDRIKAPMSLLFGVGVKAQEQLATYAPYTDLSDFCSKIQLHKENGATESTTEKVDKKTGLLKKSVKKKLGASALNSKVINTLIVSGAMDGLYSSETTVIDKILMFQETMSEVSGKKFSQKTRDELITRFKDLTLLQQFQVRKKILPQLKVSIRDILVQSDKRITFENNEFYFHPTSKLSFPVFESNLITAINNAEKQGMLPIGGLEASCVGYIISERRFNYGVQQKTAVELICDIEGEHLKVVQWPDNKNRLPECFSQYNSLDSAIVVLTLTKKPGKDIGLKNIYVLECDVDISQKEESAEPEESP